MMTSQKKELELLQRRLDACHQCPRMIGPVVHGPPVLSRILLIGQAPGPHEGAMGRPFAWTAGKTLFRWFATLGVAEDQFRRLVYMAAVARCFPGKAPKGGDRRPDPQEIEQCRVFLEEEVRLLRPKLIIPVGGLAIEQVLGLKKPLQEVVGTTLRQKYLGQDCEVICLPHPSGASTWHRTEPGISLLKKALDILGAHPEWCRTFQAHPRAASRGRVSRLSGTDAG